MKKILFALFISAVIFSCNKIQNAGSGKLTFPADTLLFDTIFTYVGSSTRVIRVYNETPGAIKIDKVFLAGGNNSKFRLNIDGIAANEATDLLLDAKDSLFIFVEITINPQTDDLLETDSIIFISGDNRQRLILQAVGQDVHFFNGQILNTQTWTNDKPYLIYNSVLVDTNQTLTIEPGVKVYSHRDSYILVRGTLKAEGTKDEPIEFRGDRIDDDFYLDKPGQWGGIIFLPGSHDNSLNYVNLSEGFYGIAVDSAISTSSPTLRLNNSMIEHCSYIGLYGTRTNILVTNSVIADCGVHNIALLMYGEYNFFHCTIQNDYGYSVRNTAAVGVQNWIKINGSIIFGGTIKAHFYNSIIYGNLKNELALSPYNTPNSFDFYARNCLLKLDLAENDTALSIFSNVMVNQEPGYIDKSAFDYHLTENSPAVGKADYQIDLDNSAFLQYDIDSIDRFSDEKADIGAYEFIKQ